MTAKSQADLRTAPTSLIRDIISDFVASESNKKKQVPFSEIYQHVCLKLHVKRAEPNDRRHVYGIYQRMPEYSRQRYKNNPRIEDIIREFLVSKGNPVSFDEIYKHVAACPSVKFTSKTPRNSVYSVLFRMADAERVGTAKYTWRSV